MTPSGAPQSAPKRAPRVSIAVTAAPTEMDFAAIFQTLDQETARITGPCRIEPLAVLIRDASGATIGGIWARIVYAWLVIEMLVVPPAARGAGLGRALMQSAEAEARARACIGIQITRLDFQAPGFYERLGFSVFGTQQDVPPGHCCFYLQKRFQPPECPMAPAPAAAPRR